METFPKQRFILLGDNSQSDPLIYSSTANQFPERIFAIYIRNINLKNTPATKEILSSIENIGVPTCFFKNNAEAIAHSKKLGLI
jgi:phosphatidate phosphatase APP1